jgi:dTMP kinase
MRKGKFITIDGVEGAGKSTQIDFICRYLTDKDINIVLTREPGGSAIGEKIRTLLLSNSTGEIHADTEEFSFSHICVFLLNETFA